MTWWLALAILLLPIVWWVLKTAIGLSVPVEVSAPMLLMRYIKEYGVEPSDVSKACVEELAKQAVQGARLMQEMGNQPFHTALDERLKQQAAIVFEYWNGCSLGFDDSPPIKTLKEYNVCKGQR